MYNTKKSRKELLEICKQHKIKGVTRKTKQQILTFIQQKFDTQTIKDDQQITSPSNMNTNPSWYKIPEITVSTFIKLIKPLYDLLEGKKTSKSEPDMFAQQSRMNYNNKSYEEWETEHKRIQIDRAFTMEWGNFHQNLMGMFPGWQNLNKGHTTKCDIGKVDGSCYGEIKNNINTMNSSSKESVLKKLHKQKSLGKRAILIIVNGDSKHKIIDGIEYMNGRAFYEELSGRPEFIDDLLATTNECFKLYKTFTQLKQSLESS